MSSLEYKDYFPFVVTEIKLEQDDNGEEVGVFSGYANISEKIDNGNDIVHRGASRKTINDNNGRLPVMWMHDYTEDIGIAHIEEDEKGLKITKGKLFIDTKSGEEAHKKMKHYLKDNMKPGLSVGYRPIKYDYEMRDVPGKGRQQIRHIHEWQLKEISVLPPGYAMNKDSQVTRVKSEIDEDIKNRLAGVENSISELYTQLKALHEGGAAGTKAEEPPTTHSEGTQDGSTGEPHQTHSLTAEEKAALSRLAAAASEE